MPNASLRLTNTGTGVRWPASTDSTGGFLFAALPVGTYEMTCELTGFKKFTQTGSLGGSNTPFGILTTQQNGARRMQFGLKLEF